MKIFYSPDQMRHAPLAELNRGVLGSAFELPVRASNVASALERARIGPIEAPGHFAVASYARVHDAGYLAFLETAHGEWIALGRSGDAVPMCWSDGQADKAPPPASLDARLGYYAFDTTTPITAESWAAVRRGADAALSGAALLAAGGARSAFSLCRPPGHHAGTHFYGGYCFLNNAAIAAQHLLDQGARRIAILDPDYHHGNGTQQIFYNRADVFYASIHADPASDFPFFTGHAQETGTGGGEGYNLNLPLPQGTSWHRYGPVLEHAVAAIGRFRPDALIVSLGVDTLAGDPLSHFRLQVDDFAYMGAQIATLACPTLFALEGGYAIDEIGGAVVRTLEGFEGI